MDFCCHLQGRLSHLAGFRQLKFKIKSKLLLLDSTAISFCLSLFGWVNYRTGKGAYDIPLLASSVIVADRYYNGFSLLNVWDSSEVFFVIRHKDNLRFTTVKENELPADRQQHVPIDEVMELIKAQSVKKYPKRFRRVAIRDDTNQHTIELIPNQMPGQQTLYQNFARADAKWKSSLERSKDYFISNPLLDRVKVQR